MSYENTRAVLDSFPEDFEVVEEDGTYRIVADGTVLATCPDPMIAKTLARAPSGIKLALAITDEARLMGRATVPEDIRESSQELLENLEAAAE